MAVACSEAKRALYAEKGEQEPLAREVMHRLTFTAHDLLVRNCLPVLTVLHRRNCLDTIGLFDEQLTTHEDWDMWVRLFHHFPFVAVHRPTCEYRHQIRGTSMTNTMMPDFYRTMTIIHKRYRPWSVAQPGVLAKQAVELQKVAAMAANHGTPVDNWGRMRCLFRSFKNRVRGKAA